MSPGIVPTRRKLRDTRGGGKAEAEARSALSTSSDTAPEGEPLD